MGKNEQNCKALREVLENLLECRAMLHRTLEDDARIFSEQRFKSQAVDIARDFMVGAKRVRTGNG
jgi:hypothetical protein